MADKLTTAAPGPTGDAWRVRRHIPVPGLRGDVDGTGGMQRLLEDIDGVLHASVDPARGRISVEYLVTRTDYRSLESALETAGFPSARGRWARWRAAWLQNLDLTGRANAAEPEPACCSRPPSRAGRQSSH